MLRGEIGHVVPDVPNTPAAAAAPAAAVVGAYVGVPVRLVDGTVYGTLCCISQHPAPALRDRLPTSLYWRTVWEQIAAGGFTLRYIPNDFIQGVAKPFVFGGIIAVTACHYGLKTTGGTEGVGQSTTRTVVTASILILIIDYFMTQVMLAVFAE
jgi:hypothetical protein